MSTSVVAASIYIITFDLDTWQISGKIIDRGGCSTPRKDQIVSEKFVWLSEGHGYRAKSHGFVCTECGETTDVSDEIAEHVFRGGAVVLVCGSCKSEFTKLEVSK